MIHLQVQVGRHPVTPNPGGSTLVTSGGFSGVLAQGRIFLSFSLFDFPFLIDGFSRRAYNTHTTEY
jgi:hypothetical protein